MNVGILTSERINITSLPEIEAEMVLSLEYGVLTINKDREKTV